jgi:hypothetical protein
MAPATAKLDVGMVYVVPPFKVSAVAVAEETL